MYLLLSCPLDATPSEEELEEEGAPCDTASTQEQPGVVTGRPCHQQQSTRVEEVHQLLAETRRTNDLLEAHSAEDVTFHARLLELCRRLGPPASACMHASSRHTDGD
ncbi:uncharacterized protein LOC144134120 [Amblyomma americanum]